MTDSRGQWGEHYLEAGNANRAVSGSMVLNLQ
jgi:hypothetical protein